jgi:hypothetical protein
VCFSKSSDLRQRFLLSPQWGPHAIFPIHLLTTTHCWSCRRRDSSSLCFRTPHLPNSGSAHHECVPRLRPLSYSAVLMCRASRQLRSRHRSPIELPVREPRCTGPLRSASLVTSQPALLDSDACPLTCKGEEHGSPQVPSELLGPSWRALREVPGKHLPVVTVRSSLSAR